MSSFDYEKQDKNQNELLSSEIFRRDAMHMAKSMPLHAPCYYFTELGKKGYKGQERGRKSLSLMAYRHIKRIKNIFTFDSNLDVFEKQNYLLIGPTGCGKTFLIELLFRDILKVPTVVVDITNFSETGYVGDDVKTILTNLIYSAKGNIYWAACGVVCMDEFDKLASSQSNVRFEGQGTSKDVTGFGVQKELLRMLEGGEIIVPLDYGFSQYGTKVKMSCKNISFIGCGAFSGFKALSQSRGSGEKLGFRWTPKQKFREKIAVSYDEDEINDMETFQIYGFLPELLGRFSRIIVFDPLDENTLKDILKSNVIRKFEEEFSCEGIELVVEEEVLDYIVKQSIKRQTGARGLNTILTGYLEDAAFSAYGRNKEGKVRLFIENKVVKVDVDPPVKDRTL